MFIYSFTICVCIKSIEQAQNKQEAGPGIVNQREHERYGG